MQEMYRNTWNVLKLMEKEALMRSLIDKLPEGFKYEGLQTFSRYGITLETGIFAYQGSLFSFIPGDEVTLGWESWATEMDEATKGNLLKTLDELDITDVELFLRECMSPVRKAAIGPFLAEHHTHPAGWREISLEDAKGLGIREFEADLKKFRASTYNIFERGQSYRLERQEQGIIVYLFNENLTPENMNAELCEEGFSLPTEDEWEYLFGGGCRTMFPWGDSFDFGMKLKYFEDSGKGEAERAYDLELPNAFGIQFLGDPYQYEWTTREERLIPKGGDGGCSICGGMGLVAGYLPAAAVYYRDPYVHELDWEDVLDNLHFRRVVRIEP